MSMANLNNAQGTALANAQTVAGFDVLNLNNAQQTAISNSNLYKTFELTGLNNTQQATMQNAVQLATIRYGKIYLMLNKKLWLMLKHFYKWI